MGRRNKEYSKTLHQQAYDRLTGMQAFGESKREAKDTETDREKIFLTAPIKPTGNTQNILSNIFRRTTRTVPR